MEGQSRLTSVHPETPDETLAVSDSERRHNLVIPLTGFSRNVFVLARKSRGCAEAYRGYAAQVSPKIDTARVERDPFRTETH